MYDATHVGHQVELRSYIASNVCCYLNIVYIALAISKEEFDTFYDALIVCNWLAKTNLPAFLFMLSLNHEYNNMLDKFPYRFSGFLLKGEYASTK